MGPPLKIKKNLPDPLFFFFFLFSCYCADYAAECPG